MKDKLQNVLLSISAKVESNKYLGSIKEAFTMFVPFIIVGSFGSMLNILVAGANGLAKWVPWLSKLSPAFTTINFVTISCMSLPIAFLIGYKLAEKEQVPQLESGLIGLLSYLAVCPNTISTVVEGLKDPVVSSGLGSGVIGAQGLFVALFVGLFVAELLTRLGNNKKLVIKMPEQVPPAVSQSFNLLLPIMIVLAVTGVLNFIFNNITSDGIQVLIYNMIQAPLTSLGSSMGTIIVFVVVQQFLWVLGIHGPNTLNALRSVIFTEQQNMNLAYVAAHGTAWGAPYPINWGSINDAFGNTGGSGATLGLIIATFIVGKKNKAQYQICKMSLAPGLFNINEPIIFGLPMVLNPLMMIPFIFVPVVNSIIAYACMAFHIVGKGVIETPWTTPAPLGAALGCMDIKAGILVIGLIILDMCLYYPFFKLMEKQKLDEENGVQNI